MMDSAASETFTLHKPSPATSASCRRLLASAKQPDCQKSPRLRASKCWQSSPVKRLRYTMSPSSDVVKRNVSETRLSEESVTTATQRCPLRSRHRTVNGTLTFTDAGESRDLSPSKAEAVHGSSEVNIMSEFTKSSQVTNRSPKVVSRSPKITNGSPKVINRSPKVVSTSPKVRSPKVVSRSPQLVVRTPEVNRFPRQSQSLSGSCVKRGVLLSPEGQPRTKKFIIERLRNAKTSRRRSVNVATGNKASPVDKSSQQKVTGKLLS